MYVQGAAREALGQPLELADKPATGRTNDPGWD